MKFKVILTDEQSEVLGEYVVNIEKKIKDFSKLQENEFYIEEENSKAYMEFEAHNLGATILNDVKAIYLQRK